MKTITVNYSKQYMEKIPTSNNTDFIESSCTQILLYHYYYTNICKSHDVNNQTESVARILSSASRCKQFNCNMYRTWPNI